MAATAYCSTCTRTTSIEAGACVSCGAIAKPTAAAREIPSYVLDRYWLRNNTRACRHCRAQIVFHNDRLTGVLRVLDLASARDVPALGTTHPTHVRLDVHRPHCSAYSKTSPSRSSP